MISAIDRDDIPDDIPLRRSLAIRCADGFCGMLDCSRCYPSTHDLTEDDDEDAWNDHMDALGARRGTRQDLVDLLPPPNDETTTAEKGEAHV